MAHSHSPDGVLATLAKGLGSDADSFTPAAADSARAPLPGRRRGEAPASTAALAVAGPGSVVLDCGTSRLEGYTHVLWISPSAESILGSHVADRIADAVAAIPGVCAYRWEGLDRLHLRATGADWDVLLTAARDAVAELAGA
ncbi:hypothetical protein [Demequina sp.]|uniref:hypothetical protein n=1 Tax=Demequina sp. TaxID=2050685 RepID=UPI003A8545E5